MQMSNSRFAYDNVLFLWSSYGGAGLALCRDTQHNYGNYLWDISGCAFEFEYLGREREIQFVSSFWFPNLKNIKIVSSSGVCLKEHLAWNYVWDYDDLFKLSEFLLKNATVLEKFVIISRGRNCKICSTNCASRYSVRLAAKLLGCPKSSTSCVIISQEGAFHD